MKIALSFVVLISPSGPFSLSVFLVMILRLRYALFPGIRSQTFVHLLLKLSLRSLKHIRCTSSLMTQYT